MTSTATPEGTMTATTSPLRTFGATVVFAPDDATAIDKAAPYVDRVDGFELTGRVEVRSAKHMLRVVEIADHGGDRDDLWVVLTSYGITPDDELGSVWQSVPGVGRFD